MKTMAISLPVEIYKEGNKFTAYTPALNLATCGDNLEDAQEKFNELVKIFLEEIEEMGTTEEVLLSCGWKKVIRHKKREWLPPVHVDTYPVKINVPTPA